LINSTPQMAKTDLSISYEVRPKKDPLTQEIIGEMFFPLVMISIKYGHRYSRPFLALVDSGSDRNLLPADIGESIGISFKKSKFITIGGIGSAQVKAFPKQVKLKIDSNEYTVSADFCFEQRIALLGRDGFFNLFQSVTFNEKTHYLDIKI